MFVTRTKFAALPIAVSTCVKQPAESQVAAGSTTRTERGAGVPPALPSPKLLILDDLPYAGDSARRQRIADALRDLTTTSRCAVAVISTTAGDGGDGGGGSGGGGGSSSASGPKGLPKVCGGGGVMMGVTGDYWGPMSHSARVTQPTLQHHLPLPSLALICQAT